MDEGVLLDEPAQPVDTSSEFLEMAELLCQYNAAVQRGEQPDNQPNPAWLSKFNRLLALHKSGPGSGPSSTQTSSQEAVGAQLAGYNAATNERLGGIEETLKSLHFHRVLDEVANRQLQLERREREKGIRITLFGNEQVKQHASDLFDTQVCVDDLTEAAQVLAPEMLNSFSASANEGLLEEASVSVEGFIPLQALAPLIKGLVGLRYVVDCQVHHQQMCGSSKVGWKDMRNYLSQDERLAKQFSGSYADKASWALYQKMCESEILKEKAHQRALLKSSQTVSETSGAQSHGVGKTAPSPSPKSEIVQRRIAKKKEKRAKWLAKKKLLAQGGNKGPNETAAGK